MAQSKQSIAADSLMALVGEKLKERLEKADTHMQTMQAVQQSLNWVKLTDVRSQGWGSAFGGAAQPDDLGAVEPLAEAEPDDVFATDEEEVDGAATGAG